MTYIIYIELCFIYYIVSVVGDSVMDVYDIIFNKGNNIRVIPREVPGEDARQLGLVSP